jgi:hypothetical protein
MLVGAGLLQSGRVVSCGHGRESLGRSSSGTRRARPGAAGTRRARRGRSDRRGARTGAAPGRARSAGRAGRAGGGSGSRGPSFRCGGSDSLPVTRAGGKGSARPGPAACLARGLATVAASRPDLPPPSGSFASSSHCCSQPSEEDRPTRTSKSQPLEDAGAVQPGPPRVTSRSVEREESGPAFGLPAQGVTPLARLSPPKSPLSLVVPPGGGWSGWVGSTGTGTSRRCAASSARGTEGHSGRLRPRLLTLYVRGRAGGPSSGSRLRACARSGGGALRLGRCPPHRCGS